MSTGGFIYRVTNPNLTYAVIQHERVLKIKLIILSRFEIGIIYMNKGLFHYTISSLINEKTKKLIITIVYLNNICFMSLKDFLLLLELK